MSCSSASVGFWPRDRMTVPSSLVVMVPARRGGRDTSASAAAGRRYEKLRAGRQNAWPCWLRKCGALCAAPRRAAPRQPAAAVRPRRRHAPSPSLSKRANASLNSAICSSASKKRQGRWVQFRVPAPKHAAPASPGRQTALRRALRTGQLVGHGCSELGRVRWWPAGPRNSSVAGTASLEAKAPGRASRHNCTLTAPCAQRLCALSAMRACGASLHLAAPRRAASRAFSHASAAPCAAQPARTQLRVARAVRAAPPRGRRGGQATCSPAAWPALQPRVAAGSSRSLCSWPLLCRSVALPAARPKRPMFHSTVSSRR